MNCNKKCVCFGWRLRERGLAGTHGPERCISWEVWMNLWFFLGLCELFSMSARRLLVCSTNGEIMNSNGGLVCTRAPRFPVWGLIVPSLTMCDITPIKDCNWERYAAFRWLWRGSILKRKGLQYKLLESSRYQKNVITAVCPRKKHCHLPKPKWGTWWWWLLFSLL